MKEEIRVNVKNRPYGLFFWTDLAGKAFDKWENNHDGYGSFEDLDAASLKDVETFFGDYYGPNNAVMAIVGDVTPAEVFAKVEKYFGALPARPVPPRAGPRRGPEHGRAHAGADRRPGPRARGRRRLQGAARGIGKDYVPLVVLGDVLAERRRLAPLPGPGEGQGAAAAGPGRAQLPLREPLAQRAAPPCSASSASTSRPRTRRPWRTRSRPRSRRSRAPGSPPPSSRG